MKSKFSLLLMGVLLTSSLVFADDSLYFPEGTKWTHLHFGYSDLLQGDTIIEDQTYLKLIRQYRNQNTEELMALKREVGSKIYVRLPGKDTDLLLYDFGLEVGDTIVHGPYEMSWCAPCTYYVNLIDTITLMDGRKAKRIHYDYRLDDVEFVGYETGFLGLIYMADIPITPEERSSDAYYYYCCSVNGEPIFESLPGTCESCNDKDDLPITTTNIPSASKILRDGQIFILRDGKTFTTLGAEIK